MTYHAAVRAAAPNGSEDVREVPVADAGDMDELISLLSADDVYTATVHDGEEDPALDAQVHGGYGYLLYAGEELIGYSVGDPDSPALTAVSDAQFPAGSGLPLDVFRAALVEFVNTGGSAPESVHWRDALDDASGAPS